ncbi:cellular tumor antigen p53-like isoform X2 [Centruroides sculpturatus]|uniref:cellular tumor antigen p53-like isoform X2 n=1 Tax=Centruroides sculpturatus TaxID=218467 RepID=UPI000C6D7366|nr:cellular tumor antigen p53-like isoform X2 [Centruroides sculpturatus]
MLCLKNNSKTLEYRDFRDEHVPEIKKSSLKMDSADENFFLSEGNFGCLWTDVDSSNRLNNLSLEDITQILNDNLPNDTEIYDDLQQNNPITEENCNPNVVLNSDQVNDIPATTNWEGPYGFDISFQSEENKNSNCVYSEVKDKLFVDMNVACSLRVKLKNPPPDGSKIRVMPIFSKPEFLTKVVKRCLIHSAPTNSNNDGHPAPQHLIRCDHEFAQYVDDPVTGRQSVVVPYENPQVGTDFTVYIYRFMCRSSCTGGLNRRATQAIFTLEKDGDLLGRKVLNVRICACPVRDKNSEETQHNKQRRNLKRAYSKTSLTSYSYSGPSHSKIPKLGDDYIEIKILRRHYECIKKVLDALAMMDILTAEQKLLINRKLSQKPSLNPEDSMKFKQYKQEFYCNKKQDLNLPSTSTGNLVRFDSNSSDDSR